MMKALALLVFAASAAAIVGCSDDNTGPPEVVAPTTTAAATSAPTPVRLSPAPAGLRAKSCHDIAPLLDELRRQDPASAAKTAEDTITWLPTTPEWATLSEADRAATIAGIRDAAAGQCHG